MIKLFAGTASKDLAQDMGKVLGVAVSGVEEHVFPDGERRIKLNDAVVGDNVVVVQSSCPPVDVNYMELFLLIDAAKRSGAEFVTAVVPYFGYQRQDHIFRDGEAVSLEVIVKILESLKIDKVVSIDLHSSRIPDLFTIPMTHVSAMPLFADVIKEKGWNTDDTVFISPDTGGIRRIKELSELLDVSYAVLEKERNLDNGQIAITNVEEGSVAGKKRAIIVDDMMASGKTMVYGADFLKKQGIDEVIAFATHPILSTDAPQLLEKSTISHVFVTDTVVVPKEKQFTKLTILSVANLLAKAV